MTEFEIMDFANRKTKVLGVDLDHLGAISNITIMVVTGDEIAHVIWANGEEEIFDSSNERLINYYDGCYTLYDAHARIDCIEKFLGREDSYWFQRKKKESDESFVHCKDCKHYESETDLCFMLKQPTYEEFFCGKGEEKHV